MSGHPNINYLLKKKKKTKNKLFKEQFVTLLRDKLEAAKEKKIMADMRLNFVNMGSRGLLEKSDRRAVELHICSPFKITYMKLILA